MNKRIIYINLDGFSYSYFEEIKKRKIDRKYHFLNEDSMQFKNLENGIISITNPMQSAILCGGWSNVTGNIYQHYDSSTQKVVKDKRTFIGENIAQTMLKNNKIVVSIHQFMLENNPCKEGDDKCCYFKVDKPQSDYLDRFTILDNMIEGKSVLSANKEIKYDTLPDLICLYIDDLDSLGHNNDYQVYPARCSHYERLEDIVERIEGIFSEIDKMIALLKKYNYFDDTIILITTDHGMTPFYGKSKVEDLKRVVEELDYKVDYEVNQETEVLFVPYTNSLGIYNIKDADCVKIIKSIKAQNYVDIVYNKKVMTEKYGLVEYGPDIMVYAKKGFHFYHRDFDKGIYGASHDSRDETSKHVFGIIIDKNLKYKEYNKKVYSIDLLPTILKNYQDLKMKDATGKDNFEWFNCNS